MTFAFGHLVGAWLFGKGYEKISKKKLGHYVWFFLLFGGILPDADLVLDWIFRLDIHRTFTHSLLFLVVAPALLYCALLLLERREAFTYSIALAGGIIAHLILDMAMPVGVPLLWPNLIHVWFGGVGYVEPGVSMFTVSLEDTRRMVKLAVFDMAIGTAWIFYLWFRKRIQF